MTITWEIPIRQPGVRRGAAFARSDVSGMTAMGSGMTVFGSGLLDFVGQQDDGQDGDGDGDGFSGG